MLQLLKEQFMDYASFIEALLNDVKEKMGEEYTVKTCRVIKNNSLELDSLVVLKAGKSFAPNIYLTPYYEAYLKGVAVYDIAEKVCSIYSQCDVPVLQEEFNYTYEEMEAFIVFRVINYERNEKLLNMVPYLKYLDMAITFHCLVRNDSDGIGTIRITNEHLKVWDKTLSDLVEPASNNTRKLFPATIKSMEEVIQGMLCDGVVPEENASDIGMELFGMDQLDTSHHKMYVLTNLKGINGASCILYHDVIREFSEQLDSDFYILPSSIHELILIPHNNKAGKDALRRMVEEVNRTQVAPEEVLSDNVYFYSRKDDKIIM